MIIGMALGMGSVGGILDLYENQNPFGYLGRVSAYHKHYEKLKGYELEDPGKN